MNHNITNYVLKKVAKGSQENDIICSASWEWAVTDELFCHDFHFRGNSEFFGHAQLRIMGLEAYIFMYPLSSTTQNKSYWVKYWAPLHKLKATE